LSATRLIALLSALCLASTLRATPTQQRDDLQPARTKGSATAPVTMYIMSDFQCPFCARFARETFPLLEREYVATGKVRMIFVNFPLPMHPNAGPAAELAMCAARQGKFWQIHDLLFRNQEHWEGMREPGTYFLGLADSAGVDRDQVTQCLQAGATRELVRSDAEGSYRSGATSTPTFYIERGLLVGAQPVATFRAVLDSIIAAKTSR
jgi:protein-disulfide isomerase